ncbi:MAG: nucleotidyltransferase domain-containing protein [Pirellulales bacterium]|nr:nucleotidyltransferase domain-containing protein [Pirellulales bacterium]
MRIKRPAEALLFPRVRQRVLATLLLHPQGEWYLTQLVRHLGCAPAHLHRELKLLVAAGVLRRRAEGRQVYYSPDPACPYLAELRALVRKTAGLPQVLADAFEPWRSRIDCAFIFGSVAKGEERSASDVDVMIVGDVKLADLASALRVVERELGRPVNPTVYPKKELVQKLRTGNHFVRTVIADPGKIFVVGSSSDLEKATRRRTDQTPQDKQAGTRRTTRRRGGKTERRQVD